MTRPVRPMRALAPLMLATSTLAVLAFPSGGAAQGGYAIVATYPHDPGAFTEGLAFRGDALFEGTGAEGSSLRRVDLVTGEVRRQRLLRRRYFGEGITVVGGRIFQLTYRDEKGWTYDARTFDRLGVLHYRGQGWGLTDDGHVLAMSDGTDVISFRDPRTFRTVRSIHVSDNGNPVSSLNELEWVNGEIYANVFPTDEVVRIDPTTGTVLGRFDLSEIHRNETQTCESPDVANGIAYLARENRLFVTGKNWCHLYEITLGDVASPSPTP